MSLCGCSTSFARFSVVENPTYAFLISPLFLRICEKKKKQRFGFAAYFLQIRAR